MRVAAQRVCGRIGGSSVAKILVADDNSNIQKMVVLALKDQGIEVVAVGNGEAAVRKISDLKPDLVLADIFMPVRNGYEVCKFVKDDSALSHIPVILLVGAFDPLDEQEASRVGADGVLKKPFVPPDPLISMVKAALARAGVTVGASASTPPPPMPTATKPQPMPVAPPPKIAPPTPMLVPDREEDLGTPVFSAPRPAPLTIATGFQHVYCPRPELGKFSERRRRGRTRGSFQDRKLAHQLGDRSNSQRNASRADRLARSRLLRNWFWNRLGKYAHVRMGAVDREEQLSDYRGRGRGIGAKA